MAVRDRSSLRVRRASPWLLAGLIVFAVGVYLMTILAYMAGFGGG